MEYLELLENPRTRRPKRRHNPVGFDEFGNPVYLGGGNSMSRRTKRNPATSLAMPKTFREWTQGVDVMDAGAAVGGLSASTMLPGMFIKDTVTTGQKLMKIGASLIAAMGAGALGKAMISSSAGKAAVIGGFAGTFAQALGMFTNIQIGRKSLQVGETSLVSPATTREAEKVSFIQP